MSLLVPSQRKLDEQHLATALGLARTAVGLASPNPTVGCVLAQGEAVLGEGAHRYEERDHAEIAALKQAASLGHDVLGATAYVTLEPCSHQGRTGPCADALIAAGIMRCVIATVDPNPLVRGNGIAKLRHAGVEVVLAEGSLCEDARRLNDAFACFIQHKRPFVTLKAALSVDGKLAPPPSSRLETAPHWITGVAARNDAQTLRHEADAILTGIGTVMADNPSLTDRTGLPRRRGLLRVVLDSRLRTPLDSALVTTAAGDLLIVCGEGASTEREEGLTARGAEVLRLHEEHGRLNLTEVFAALADRSILSVLVEAGAALNGSLLRADLVDRLVLYYAERELGLDAVPFAADYDSPYALQQRLTSTTRKTFPNENTEDVRIAGYLHDPWSGRLYSRSMFTGLIEATGSVVSFNPGEGATRLIVAAPALTGRWRTGDSIAVNGVCLTAIPVSDPAHFAADLAAETLARTTLGELAPNTIVNLELPTPAGSPLGGHVVQGHVDATGYLETLVPLHSDLESTDWRLTLELSSSLAPSIVSQGSITVDGISLTVAKVHPSAPDGSLRLDIAIIPHTYKSTNLHTLASGSRVNIETDVLARYAAAQRSAVHRDWLTADYLLANGY